MVVLGFLQLSFWGMIACIVLGIVFLAIYIREKCRLFSMKMVMYKIRVSLCFVGAAVFASFLSGNVIFSIIMIMGLVFGLCGDVWLDLKLVDKTYEANNTFAGFRCFLIGHICYMIAIIAFYGASEKILFIIIPFIIAVVLGIAVVFAGEKAMGLKFENYKAISAVYGAFLFGMTLLSGSLAIMWGFSSITLIMLFVGGVLFAISDLVLSQMYFGNKTDSKNIAINNITYFGAQFIIAVSLVFAGFGC